MFKTSSFTKRYVLALSITATLSTLAYFNLDKLISIQSDNSRLISISSRQKILAQQIAFHAIYYKIKNLKKNLILMESSHNLLISSPMTKALEHAYFSKPMMLDQKVKTYLKNAKSFEEHRDGKSLTYLLKHSNSLLLDLDKAVSLYLEQSRADTKKLKEFEFYIFILTLTTLFFEAILIFRPANKNINKKTQELTEEKDYSNAVIESSTNAIITLDKNLRIHTYNKMAEQIFGYTKAQMLHQSSFGKIVPQQYERLSQMGVENFIKTLKLDTTAEVLEVEGVNNRNQMFPIRISFGTSGENETVAIVANIQDISKEKLKDKLLQHQAKFAALGEMIAVIAHQWRQPLAELNFNCMYVRNKLKDPELIAEAQKNEDIIQFMSETITNFEDFYKNTKNTVFNPIVSINQALNILDSVLKLNQIKLIKHVDSKISIYGNSNTLAQVVLSILQNAVDIFKAKKIANPEIIISLKDVKKHIMLSIQDNAGGIEVSPVDDIFKPFNSKKIIKSTGIGLYMARMVIESKFNGSIKAGNVKSGAIFVILLPH
ncbi:PAS domain-containing sensor histidine kinase [Sulfurospirillum sp. 1612]|uniref:PAS domain-containing sensor histidine kinase n=1 Tax=Sulfurospirillum sp. 1612 TaxID=3094835 RepID=UPI002F936530